MESDVIYNKNGKPLLRLLENGRFVSFNGRSVGFLEGENAYDYNGSHRGWYSSGILRDHNGLCVGFGEEVTDSIHPLLPLKHLKPLASLEDLEPLRPLTSLPPLKPLPAMKWSKYDPISLFL